MKDESNVFKKKAYEVRIKLLLSKYAPLIAIVAVIILVIVFKIYFSADKKILAALLSEFG